MNNKSDAVLIALAMSACGGERDHPWTTSTDTTPRGIVVVVNDPPGEDIGPTWRLEKQVRIGSANDTGPALFGLVKGLLVLDDGRIVILDAQS